MSSETPNRRFVHDFHRIPESSRPSGIIRPSGTTGGIHSVAPNGFSGPKEEGSKADPFN